MCVCRVSQSIDASKQILSSLNATAAQRDDATNGNFSQAHRRRRWCWRRTVKDRLNEHQDRHARETATEREREWESATERTRQQERRADTLFALSCRLFPANDSRAGNEQEDSESRRERDKQANALAIQSRGPVSDSDCACVCVCGHCILCLCVQLVSAAETRRMRSTRATASAADAAASAPRFSLLPVIHLHSRTHTHIQAHTHSHAELVSPFRRRRRFSCAINSPLFAVTSLTHSLSLSASASPCLSAP